MWPFTADIPGLWLALYVLTFALHAAFVGYVAIGTGYALVQALRGSEDPTAERIRDRLPFMLGCAITAGVAPLLFLQLLYQHRFYTANLLLGPRWGAVVPALIAGFYALYLAKAAVRLRWRRLALGVGLLCFAFVAWSWTELHLLMRDEPAWRAMYAAGTRIYADAGVAPRLLLWIGAMGALFAALAVWWERGEARRRLAAIALAGLAIVGIAAGWLVARGASAPAAAHGWLYLAIAGAASTAVAWIWTWRSPDGAGATVVAGATAAALVSGAVVREAPRLALLEPPRAAAADAGGMPVFLATLVLGVVAISWIARTVRASTGHRHI
ncbi:MAG TPA: hypothetical protein VK932_28720 [Kofleriaceae bacterium]|nr:hypothetical protein [Kofleriaceae bacterium]